MNNNTLIKLEEDLEICDREERSTEYTIQFLMHYAKVDFDCVIKFLTKA